MSKSYLCVFSKVCLYLHYGQCKLMIMLLIKDDADWENILGSWKLKSGGTFSNPSLCATVVQPKYSRTNLAWTILIGQIIVTSNQQQSHPHTTLSFIWLYAAIFRKTIILLSTLSPFSLAPSWWRVRHFPVNQIISKQYSLKMNSFRRPWSLHYQKECTNLFCVSLFQAKCRGSTCLKIARSNIQLNFASWSP